MADTQDLVVDLKIKDNLSVGLANAKKNVEQFGDAASREAARAEGAFGNAASGIRSKFSGIGADIAKGIGLGLGIGAVQLTSKAVSELTGFLKDSVGAAIEEEAGIRQLGQSLLANIPAFDGNTEAIERQIKAGEALGFTDDELRASLAALAGSTHDVAKAFDIQALAQDLARFKNESLEAATAELVKVQAGSLRSLKALGIELAAGTSATEAFGAIQKVVAGQSDAFADTTAGKMAKASAQIKNLQEDIGNGLIPVIGQLADALDAAFRDNGAGLANKAAEFVKTATIAQIKSAREGVAKELANAQSLFGPHAAEGDIKKVLAQLDEAIAEQGHGMDESARSAIDYARSLSVAQAAASSAKEATANLSVAQIAVAQATIDASRAHADLGEAQKAAGDAAVGDKAAIADLAVAMANNATATAALKAAQDDLAESLKAIPPAMLGAASEIGSRSREILAGGNAAVIAAGGFQELADQIDRLKGIGGKPFVSPNIKIPGLDDLTGGKGLPPGGVTLPESFLSDLDQDERNRQERKRRDDEAAAKRLQAAKDAASQYADVLAGKLDAALKKEKDTAASLFDTVHARHLQAIADTEKLAEKQHDTALQAISDALKVRLAANAAPVDAAERRQQQIELSRQRRDLGESLQAAQQSGDPEAIRRASEALQSFNAAQRIAALKVDQATKDLAAQTEAAAQQKAADDKLAAAKLAQAAGIEDENKRFKKQTDDFDRALAALKIRDKGASPGKIAKDISDLEGKFGITRDAQGHSHIDDPLVIAIKTIKIPAPTVNLYPTFYSPPIFLNGRLIASALASNLSPAATPGVRTGTLTPKAAG